MDQSELDALSCMVALSKPEKTKIMLQQQKRLTWKYQSLAVKRNSQKWVFEKVSIENVGFILTDRKPKGSTLPIEQDVKKAES